MTVFNKNLQRHIDAMRKIANIEARVQDAATLMTECLRNGGRLLFCGNGGSAADAQHLAAEFTGRFKFDRSPLDAHALHSNTSSLTAVGNDYGFEQVFSRGVIAHGRTGDVLIGISTSGQSANVVLAMQEARKKGMYCIALTGNEGREMEVHADILLNVPAHETPRIQELHIFIGHTICEIVEENLFGKPSL